MSYCTRCHRKLTREPVIVAGHGYGRTCAAKVEGTDLLTPPVRITLPRRRRTAAATPQMPLEAMQ